MSNTVIHQLPTTDVFGVLDSRSAGLSAREAAARLIEAGPNCLTSPSSWRWLSLLAKHFGNLFSVLLYISAAACFVAEAMQSGQSMAVLGWALIGVAVLNAVFAFVQEYRAERAMEELKKYLPQKARVRRGGQDLEILAEQIVPGDVLVVTEGERISADARLVQSEELLVNNAPLTGEARPVPLVSRPTRDELLDSQNVLFAGTNVLRGSGVAVVFATGPNTAFGKIASLSRDVRRPASPIQRETNRMVRVLTIVAVTMGVLFFAYGVISGRSLWVNLVFAMGIIVANVPEGLLPTLTLALSLASQRMARRQVLVKSLASVEALGAMHVICTDKTGTLTRNELAIARVVDGVRGDDVSNGATLQSVLQAALVASVVRGKVGRFSGDPLDVAVAERYTELFGPATTIIAETRRHFPFDLERRREAGVLCDGQTVLFAVKGAWESLRPLVAQVEAPQGEQPLPADDIALAACDNIVHGMSSLGQRVIAVAYRHLSSLPSPLAAEESLERNLILKGFLALDDPLRDDVPAAVLSCHAAGIRVVLVTGDHPDTAEAVARQCGILRSQEPREGRIILGHELAAMGDDELAERLRQSATVFARTTPEQKMKIVAALKGLGCVVGMTGDGVNDAAALKAADVGIAMGVGGTDVARESADIVLLDNSFASIVAGVEEGRAVFSNIQKFTTYVLASNIPEIVPYLLYIVFPIPLALTIIQILSIDLGTDLLPAIGLGQEPPETDALKQPPRRAEERLLSFRVMATAYLFLGMIQAGFSLALFFFVLYRGGWHWGVELAATDALYQSATGITLASVILMQIGNLVGRRSLRQSGLDTGLLRNRLMLLGIALEIAFSWAILYYPPVQTVLGTGPVSPLVYLCAWLGIPLLFGIDLLRKKLLARSSPASAPRVTSAE